MKKLYLLTVIILHSLIGIAQNIKALDEKNGFREMKFGDSAIKFDDLAPIEFSKDSLGVYYKRTGDKLTIGESEVEIVYFFYKGQLSSVSIRTKGYSNSTNLLKVLQEMFGKGYKGNRYLEDYYWAGKKVQMFFIQNSATDDSEAYMSSVTMREIQDKDEAEKLKKAKGDF